MTPKQRAPYSVMMGSPATPGASPASTQRFSQDLPDIAFAFVSDSGYKVGHPSGSGDLGSMSLQIGYCLKQILKCFVVPRSQGLEPLYSSLMSQQQPNMCLMHCKLAAQC